jgi:hypothetical protein
MEGAREASLGGDEGSEPLDPLGERRKGRVHIGEHNGRIRARIDLPSEYGRDQVRATWEAAVEGGYPDPSRVRNLTHRSIYSRRCKHRFRRIEQSVEAALRVGAPRPFSAQPALAVVPSVVCRSRLRTKLQPPSPRVGGARTPLYENASLPPAARPKRWCATFLTGLSGCSRHVRISLLRDPQPPGGDSYRQRRKV